METLSAGGSNWTFFVEISFRQPSGKIIIGGAWQGDAPNSIGSGPQADLTFTGAALFADPDDHESRPHVPALQAHDKTTLQLRCHAIKAGSANSNVEGPHVLRKHLTVTVQPPEPHGNRHGQTWFATDRHEHILSWKENPGLSNCYLGPSPW